MEPLSQAQAEGLSRIADHASEYIVGIDEVGLGAIAGPVVVASAVLPRLWSHREVKDSKKYHDSATLTAHQKRKNVVDRILAPPLVFHCIIFVDAREVDRLGVDRAVDKGTVEAGRAALRHYPDSMVVLDGLRRPRGLRKHLYLEVFPKADSLVTAVSAASLLAKVERDSYMLELSEQFPGYALDEHMGYPTPTHKELLYELGPSPIHRRSYKPVAQAISLFSQRRRELDRMR